MVQMLLVLTMLEEVVVEQVVMQEMHMKHLEEEVEMVRYFQ